MRLLAIVGLAALFSAIAAGGEPLGYWKFDDGKPAATAAAIASTVHSPALDGKAAVHQQGKAPAFDAHVAAAQIWDGCASAWVNSENRAALRFQNAGPAGAGSPVGGQVLVAGDAPLAQPASFTAEAFVKMERQQSRHALIMSKRRRDGDGASWSLSIDPQGRLRARFDTQPLQAEKKGGGFNQSFGSSGNLPEAEWRHVALRYNQATRQADIFVDYVRCGGGVASAVLVYDAGELVIGRGLCGWIDEVRLSGEALHPEQFLRPTRFFSDLKPKAHAPAMLDQTSTRVQTGLQPGLERIGTLKPKGLAQLETSMWSLGCETLDRDLADWDAYKGYLEPLGIRRIRLQGGWARTEKVKGVYDFAWLDQIVDDALARGLKVCLETSYGNRLYQPDAGLGPGGPLPEGEETLAAWDQWVEAMARRYAAKGVKEWMMYNEPNLRKENTADKAAALNIRTAAIIKRVDPEARIGGLVSAGLTLPTIKRFLEVLKEENKTDLFHWVIYHSYTTNPDTAYASVPELREVMRELAPQLRIWQGEAGCASEEVQFALSGVDWTEFSQAKWNARRMLGDLGHDIESLVFTISDLAYHRDFISRYGLLKTNPDNSIIKVKAAYYMTQNLVSLFNDAVARQPNYDLSVECEKELAWYAYRDKKTGLDLVAFWDGAGVPSNRFDVLPATLTVKEGHFQSPVWVDLLTGGVYTIPAEKFTAAGQSYTFRDVPFYDSPVVLTDKSLLSFEPARPKKKK